MSQVTPLQTSFNGGELSRRMHSRVDQAVRAIGVRTMDGWLPTLAGPAEACPGLIDVAALKDPRAIPVPFGFTVTQHYVVEVGPGYCRFFTNEAQIESAPGVPLEVAAPWTADQLDAINWCQVGEFLYLYHGDVQTQVIKRTGGDSFTIEPVTFDGGPYDPANEDRALTVSANGVDGAVTLTSTSPIFEAGDVGGLFRIQANDLGQIPAWEPGITITAGELRQSPSLGIVYQALSGGKTGSVEPTHPEGSEWDGMGTGTDSAGNAAGGVQWLYLHDRYGVLRITGFTNTTHVSATVIRRLPFTISSEPIRPGAGGSTIYDTWEPTDFTPGTYTYSPPGTATFTPGAWRWQFGAYSNRRGWPACGVIFNERHVVAKDNVIDGSVVGDFNNMAPLNEFGDISLDQAFRVVLNMPDAVRWLAADNQLLAGTARAEYTLSAYSAAQGFGPGNIRTAEQAREGAAKGMPVVHGGRAIFVQRAGRRLVEFGYQVARDRYEAPDLSRFAEHIGLRGFGRIAAQREPSRLIWTVCDDGTLAAVLYDPNEEALGWCRRTVGGGWRATGLTSIVGSDGKFDQLWVTVQSPDGSSGRMTRLARTRISSEQQKPVMLDLCAIVESETPVTTISIPWLAGFAVQAWTDDVAIVGLTVPDDGELTLPFSARTIIVGLPYPATMTLLALEAGGDNGPALMKQRKIARAGIDLVGRGLWLGVQGGQAQPIATGTTADPLNGAMVEFDGIHWLQTIGSYEREGRQTIDRRLPFAATVLAIQAEQDVSQTGGSNQ